MNDEFNRVKTDNEQLNMQNHEQLNQEIVQLRQTNDVSLRKDPLLGYVRSSSKVVS